jgi:hypothetical protein
MTKYTIGWIAILIFAGRSVEAQMPYGGRNGSCPALFPSSYRALVCALSGQVLERLRGMFLFIPQADGGGDGGGDGGDGGDGTGAGDGTGDSGDSGDGDGPSGETGTVGAPGDQGDPGNNDDATDPSAVTDPTSPTTVTAIDNTVADVPTNDPALGLRGPGSPGTGITESLSPITSVGAVFPQFLGGSTTGASVDVGINAVIVSGAPTPWEAIGKVPGVRIVTVMGGIIALGETVLSKPPLGVTFGNAGNPPEWLKFKPDLRYLNGSVFPPVVPNVIDVRTISNTEEIIENPSK